jgi:hypothetical protein
MPYDRNLDVESFRETKEFGETRITVSVYSYNNGPKKLQVVRENHASDDEWRFTKLGRLSKEEAETIIPVMQKALGGM